VILLLLLLIGFLSWFLGTVSAGGAGLIFLFLASFVLPIEALPIILGFAGTIAGSYRAFIYRHEVNWKILYWLLPGTVAGSLIGASLFATLVTKEATEILSAAMGVILIVSGLTGLLRKEEISFRALTWYFFPFGLLTALVSGLIGAASPIINILFQKFPLTPNQMVGTKAFGIFVLQASKSVIYALFLLFEGSGQVQIDGFNLEYFLLLSVMTAIGASGGVYFGKRLLSEIDPARFKLFINLALVLFGIYFLV